ncbi:hypothetical protein C8F04DRAFT_1246261 [Mycena alexandri]|uniref:Uncharacterized protein n=1 Tax=Mycena alexandri TaxID=1745969 RepID=A0AAD6RZ75_9AGAR|nr:hypothetical protein C8F04DRAFT_1246261 [Mycena alexandri]
MTITIIQPNHALSADYIDKYNQEWDDMPLSPVPVQYPSHLDIAPEQVVYIANGHRAATSVPSGSPSSATADVSATSPTDCTLTSPSAPPSSPTSIASAALGTVAGLLASSRALIPTFDPTDGWAAMDSVVTDAVLRTYLRLALYSPFHTHIPSKDDVCRVVEFGQTSWAIRAPLCTMAVRALQIVAYFILCAANDHNPYFQGGPPDLPSFIDLTYLDQLGLRIPAIILFRSYSENIVRNMRFPDEQAAIDYPLSYAGEFGYRCSWRWGAPLAMAHTEWTHRITRHFVYDGHKSLEHLMSHQLLKNEMDFGCAALLSPFDAVRLLSIIRAERHHLAIWPVTDPISQQGDIFLRQHLHELNTSISTLNHIVARTLTPDELDL